MQVPHLDFRIWALLSALFAGITAVLVKVGTNTLPSQLALFIRVCAVMVVVATLVTVLKEWRWSQVSNLEIVALLASGLTTGASWLCYFQAMKQGTVSRVAPIDKLSFVVAMILGVVVLKESITWKVGLGATLIGLGALLTIAQ